MTTTPVVHAQGKAQQDRPGVSGEAVFALDEKGRIVLWSPSAQATLGFSEGEVLGRRCWEIVEGRDVFGRPLPCHLWRRFLQQEIPNLAQRHFLIRRKDGRLIRLSHEMVLLPDGPGARALVLMKTFSPKPDGSTDPPTEPDLPSLPPRHWWDMMKWLATLGVITNELATSESSQILDSSLEQVLSMTRAEAVELFLYHHPSREMLLTGHRGMFRSAFYQIPRFQVGEGFPGLVAANGEPIVTLELPRDPRYLRTKVKEKGIQFYLCVPLKTDQGVIGCLNIASRKCDQDVPSQLQFLTWVSKPLSLAVELTWLRSQRAIDHLELLEPWEITGNHTLDLEQALRQAMRAMMAAGQAQGGRVVLYNVGSGAILGSIKQPGHGLGDCSLLGTGHGRATPCPALATGRPALSSSNHPLPEIACRGMLREAPAALCLPLSSGATIFGVVTLTYAERHELLTRRLALLGAMAHRAAIMLWPLYCGMKAAEVSDRPSSKSAPSSRCWTRPEVRLTAPTEAGPYLDIRCLGDFQVYRQGRLLTAADFGRRQAITVLKVLITHRGCPVSQDLLMEYLWPDANPDRVRRGLWVAVRCLRRALEPSLEKKPSVIVTVGDAYQFNTQTPYRLDVVELLQGMRRGEEAESRGELEKALETYQQAAQLYRGDFLEDEPYSDWCAAEREYLREVYLSLLRRIAGLYEAKGDYERAALHYRHALARDPLREELHRRLMACLWHGGRRDEALRQYHECSKLLSTELGVEPLRETQALYRRIISKQEDPPKHLADTAIK